MILEKEYQLQIPLRVRAVEPIFDIITSSSARCKSLEGDYKVIGVKIMHKNIPNDLVKLLDVSPKIQVVPRNHPVFVAKPKVGTTVSTSSGEIKIRSEDEFLLTRFEGDYLKFTLAEIDIYDSPGFKRKKECPESENFNFCDYRDIHGTSLASSLRDIKVIFDWRLYKSTLSPYSNYGTYLKSSMDFSEENLKEYGYLGLYDNHFVKIGNTWFVLSDMEYKFYFTGEVKPYKFRPETIVDESELDWKFVYTDFKAYCSEIRKSCNGILTDCNIGCSRDYIRGKAVFKCNLEALNLSSDYKLDEREVTILYKYDKLHKEYRLRLKIMSPDFKTSNVAFSISIPYKEAGKVAGSIKRTLKSSLGKKPKTTV